MSTTIDKPNPSGKYFGTSGDDYIYTPLGSSIIGTTGNDYVDGGFYSGGSGMSSIDYSQLGLTTAFDVNLVLGSVKFTINGNSYTQSLKNIDYVIGVNGKSGVTNTFTGNSNNNIFGADALSDTFIGGGGFDTVDFSREASGVNVNLLKGTATLGTITDKLSGISGVYGSTAASNTMTGDTNNNVFVTGGKGDIVNGGGGIDTCVYKPSLSNTTASSSTYSIGVGVSGQINVGPISTPGVNVDLLTNIQRLQFTDINLAFDLNSTTGTLTGNAGIVEKILGAVFGPSYLQNQQYIGIGLAYLDKGTTYSQLVDLALAANNLSTPIDVITNVWTNIIGTAPPPMQISNIISSGILMNTFVMQAADSVFNTSQINLVGIAKQGLAYIPHSL
ncbi:MAG: hypothetical protein WCP66_12780 [Methylococcales bacterium]